ncbi:hypothetical protein [Clavibacter tessellarius]|uniref:hypothetical protein n=1 Tax=Clavibacter tessellarius TaxID=31965 RepID=UPI003249B62E
MKYDSRIPAPLAILFHGNGSDATKRQSNGPGSSIANALVAAGYTVVGAANTPNVSTGGAQAGLDDDYVAAYRFVRDHSCGLRRGRLPEQHGRHRDDAHPR